MNATAASLLGLLDTCGGELTGGELVRVAEQRIGEFWTLTRSQVYRELAALEQDGLVALGAPGARDSRPYRVTAEGRRTYRRWLTEQLPPETLRIPLLLLLAFGSVLPRERVAAAVAAAHDDHRERLAGYRRLDAELERSGADPYTRATLSFGLHYERAVLRWFATMPPEVAPASATSRAGSRAVARDSRRT